MDEHSLMRLLDNHFTDENSSVVPIYVKLKMNFSVIPG